MKKLFVACISTLATLAAINPLAAYADTQLYETGPSEDSSFVRFLNASDDKASVVNGAAKIALGNQGDARVSRFYPVKAGSKLTATVQIGSHKVPVEVTAKPGEFITIAVVGKDASAKSVIVRESPTDFNAMRSSLSLSNLDEKCASAALSGGAKNTAILEAVKPATVQRRLINPVKLSVQASCDGKSVGTALDMSQLQAGERYSVFVLPLKAGRIAFFVRDNNS